MRAKPYFRTTFMIFFISLTLIVPLNHLFAQNSDGDIVIGKAVTIHSKVLNENRQLLIYLPQNYENSPSHYPVLYLLDGRGHFHDGTGVVEFLSSRELIPQMIVVAIPNTDRNRDFTPTKDPDRESGGGAVNFQKFLKEELFPYIEKNYRTQPYRILFGHSLTGMFTLYTLFTAPDLFSAYIAASPWVIYDRNYLVNQLPELLKEHPKLNKYLFMTVGDEPNLLPTFDKFLDILKANTPAGLDWQYMPMPEDDHGSVTHLTLYNGLRKLFVDWRMPDEVTDSGIEGILQYYKNLSKKYGYTIAPSELMINALGYRALQQNKTEQAIELFKYNVSQFPDSPNVYDSLGEGYEAAGELLEAKKNYEIAYDRGMKVGDANTGIYKQHLDNIKVKMGEL